jgi:hypothetical protein
MKIGMKVDDFGADERNLASSTSKGSGTKNTLPNIEPH